MTPEDVAAFFTRSDGTYFCARWGRPIAPVVFGAEEATIATVKGAFEALCALAGHEMAETDPELGANVMVFFCRSWDELPEVPNLDRLVDGLATLVTRLKEAEANQYRVFRFDEGGAIRACFVFLRMDQDLSKVPAQSLALAQAAQTMLVWSDTAFATKSALGRLPNGTDILHPDVAAVIRAAYDPVLPQVAQDATHGLRLSARITAGAQSH